MCPDASDVNQQFLDKISVTEEGTTAGVRMIMVRKCRPVANKVLAPHSKLSTAAGTPPKYGGSIICSLDPSFTSGVDCKKLIKLIQSRSEHCIRANHQVL